MKLPEAAPTFHEIIRDLDGERLLHVMSVGTPVDRRGRYLHWDEARNRTPPDGLSAAEWWAAMRFARNAIARPLPLLAKDGAPFVFSNVDPVQRAVHEVDKQAGGQIGARGAIPADRTPYLVSSLTEEAITSSQLEGATTTRKEAKRLLASGRPPRDLSELMIVNNYKAMMRAKEMVDSPLRPADVLDLHRIVTEGTLEDPRDAGRLQEEGDERIGVYSHDDTLVHAPPPAHELPERLDALCHFANGKTGEGFVHPVVRAILLHFALSYDHPFSDGNGRTARALFYWSMLDSGYWLAEYVSISSVLKKAPSQYTRSFLHTETDGNDVTYFVLYQLTILLRAIEELGEYLQRRIADTQKIEAMARGTNLLNHRQLDVVRGALHDPGEPVTIAEHRGRHDVTTQTSRTDLLGLEDLGLFEKRKRGRAFVFFAKPGLEERLRALGDAS